MAVSFVGIVEDWEQLDLWGVLFKIQPCCINAYKLCIIQYGILTIQYNTKVVILQCKRFVGQLMLDNEK
jgi:hypothetical protein